MTTATMMIVIIMKMSMLMMVIVSNDNHYGDDGDDDGQLVITLMDNIHVLLLVLLLLLLLLITVVAAVAAAVAAVVDDDPNDSNKPDEGNLVFWTKSYNRLIFDVMCMICMAGWLPVCLTGLSLIQANLLLARTPVFHHAPAAAVPLSPKPNSPSESIINLAKSNKTKQTQQQTV